MGSQYKQYVSIFFIASIAVLSIDGCTESATIDDDTETDSASENSETNSGGGGDSDTDGDSDSDSDNDGDTDTDSDPSTDTDPAIAQCIAVYGSCTFGSCDADVDGGAVGIWWYPVSDAGDVSPDAEPPNLFEICVASYFCSCAASYQIREGEEMRSATVEELCTFLYDYRKSAGAELATYEEYYVK